MKAGELKSALANIPDDRELVGECDLALYEVVDALFGNEFEPFMIVMTPREPE